MYHFIRNFKINKDISGILLMIVHAAALAALYIAGKNLTNYLHSNQVTFLYKFSILVAILPWCFYGGIKENLKTKKLGIHVTRGTFSVMANLCFFYGLQEIHALDAAAISYLENILVVTVGVLYFKEKLTKSKVILIICGFVGAVFVIKPGFQEFNSSYFFLFLALIFWAINNLSIKILGRTERGKAQIFYTMLLGSIFSLPLALEEWRPIKAEYIKYIFLLAFFHLVHVIAFFKALKFSDISSVMPFDYSRLLFTGILGYIFLNEVPDQYSTIGYMIIVIGGLYLIHDEGKKKGFFNKKNHHKINK